MPTSQPYSFRRARGTDAPALIRLICALADFEKLPRPDAAAQGRLAADGFGPTPRFESWLAHVPENSDPVGYAILFETYSTFLAKPTLYLEDIFVLPDFRHQGVGTAFLEHCVAQARERGCGRMEWTCLDWNTKAQSVYECKLGAKKMSEWLLYRLIL